MTYTQEEIEKMTVWVRPNCHYCKTPESALLFWSGRECCGSCVAKLHEWQQSESERVMREVINRGE